jgi:hypothetical protein
MIDFVGGIIIGCLMLLVKYCSFWLLTSQKNENGKYEQRNLKRWLIFGPYQPVRDRIHESTLLLFCIDLIGGYIGMHALASFGATNFALIAMCAYTITCMTILMWHIIFAKLKDKFGSWFEPSHKKKYAWED